MPDYNAWESFSKLLTSIRNFCLLDFHPHQAELRTHVEEGRGLKNQHLDTRWHDDSSLSLSTVMKTSVRENFGGLDRSGLAKKGLLE